MTPEERQADAEALAAEVKRLLAAHRSQSTYGGAADVEPRRRK